MVTKAMAHARFFPQDQRYGESLCHVGASPLGAFLSDDFHGLEVAVVVQIERTWGLQPRGSCLHFLAKGFGKGAPDPEGVHGVGGAL